MKILFVTVLAFLFHGAPAFSQTTYTWNVAGGGSWATASNWIPSRTLPAANDILIINNSGTKTITNVPTQTIGRLTIGGNSTITLSGSGGNQTLTIANGTGDDLIVENGSTLVQNNNLESINLSANCRADISGSFSINRSYNTNAANVITTVSGTLRLVSNNGTIVNATPAKLFFTAGSTYEHSRNGGTIPTAAWNAASNCFVTGITGTAPTGLNQSFGNFSWDCTGQSTGFLLNGVLTTVNGNLSVGNTNLFGVFLATASNSSYTLDIGGDFIINDNAWLSITNGDNITATVNVAGDFNMTGISSSSTFFDYHAATGGAVTLNKIIMNIAGDFIQSGGLFDFAYGDSDASNFTELHLSGNLTISNSGLMQTGSADNSVSNGTIIFNKPGIQTFFAATPANIAYVNYVVNNGSTLEMLSDISLSSIATAVWAGQFTVNAGAVLNIDSNRIVSSSGATAGVNNSFILNDGAVIISANPDGLQHNETIGSVSTAIATRTFRSNADYEFKGAVTGTFITTPIENTARDIIINNTSGNVTLSQPMAVTRSFILASGNLITTITNLLTINDDATSSAGSYSPVRYVDGPVRKIGDDTFTFPVGKSGVYAPISISAPGTVNDEFLAEYMRTTPPNRFSITAPGLNHISFCEYWNLEEIGPGSPTVNVSLSWSGLSPCNTAAYINDLATLTVAQYNGTSWDSHGNSGGTTGSGSLGTVTRNNVSVFTPFSIGSTSAGTNPLTVKFSLVKAYPAGNINKIEWTNSSEEGVGQYEVERSTNGISFVMIKNINARSNAGTREDYVVNDENPYPDISFYRIKAVEINGEFSYSPVIKIIRNTTADMKLQVYPNPVVNRQFVIQLRNQQRGNYLLKLFNNSGQEVYQTNWQFAGGSASRTIELPSGIIPGMYHVQLSANESMLQSKIIIR